MRALERRPGDVEIERVVLFQAADAFEEQVLLRVVQFGGREKALDLRVVVEIGRQVRRIAPDIDAGRDGGDDVGDAALSGLGVADVVGELHRGLDLGGDQPQRGAGRKMLPQVVGILTQQRIVERRRRPVALIVERA